MENVRVRLEDSEKEKKQLVTKLAQQEKNKEELGFEMEKLRAEKEQLALKLAQQENNKEDQAFEMKNLRARLEECEKEKEQLEENMRVRLEDSEKEKKQLVIKDVQQEKNKEDLGFEMKKLRARLEDSEKEKEQLVIKHVQQEKNKEDLGFEMEKLRAMLEDSEKEKEQLVIKYEKFEKESDYLKLILTSMEEPYTIGGPGKEGGRFDHPCGIAIDENSDLVIADKSNRRVQVIGWNNECKLQFYSVYTVALAIQERRTDDQAMGGKDNSAADKQMIIQAASGISESGGTMSMVSRNLSDNSTDGLSAELQETGQVLESLESDIEVGEAQEGSIRYNIKCKTSKHCKVLWRRYQSGELRELVQKTLITPEVLKNEILTETYEAVSEKEKKYTTDLSTNNRPEILQEKTAEDLAFEMENLRVRLEDSEKEKEQLVMKLVQKERIEEDLGFQMENLNARLEDSEKEKEKLL
ncbi:flagellar attachment zone protein 1-like [Ptychodera flava]|uniref:flagellar attachment zone protein 1-like n=1 Tax=Ptychodera flava TaxID=63121 RepID=UPI003969FA9C